MCSMTVQDFFKPLLLKARLGYKFHLSHYSNDIQFLLFVHLSHYSNDIQFLLFEAWKPILSSQIKKSLALSWNLRCSSEIEII